MRTQWVELSIANIGIFPSSLVESEDNVRGESWQNPGPHFVAFVGFTPLARALGMIAKPNTSHHWSRRDANMSYVTPSLINCPKDHTGLERSPTIKAETRPRLGRNRESQH
jgi:hypothetical protein